MQGLMSNIDSASEQLCVLRLLRGYIYNPNTNFSTNNVLINSQIASVSGDNITILRAGKYRILGASYPGDGGATVSLTIQKNGSTVISTAENINMELTLSVNDVIKAYNYSNSADSFSSSVFAIIK